MVWHEGAQRECAFSSRTRARPLGTQSAPVIEVARLLTLAAALLLTVVLLLAGACNSGQASGPAQCEAAGGQCVLGSARCANPGTQDCNPDRNPGGAFCCLSGLCTAEPVQASNYDQTCQTDTDCVAIAEGDPCLSCGISCSSNATINAGALTKYRSDIANTPAVLSAADGGCLYTCGTVSGRSDFGPFCCGGTCHVGGQCPGADASTDACAPSGCTGSCVSLSAHNVSTMVNGCLVWQCCVPDDDGGIAPAADANTE
jgi:hypothetical protein